MGFRGGLAACTAFLIWGASDFAVAQSARQFTGIAAYYSTDYSGRTAHGDRYDPTKFTAHLFGSFPCNQAKNQRPGELRLCSPYLKLT